MPHILIRPAGSTEAAPGAYLDASGFEVLLIEGDRVLEIVGVLEDDFEDRLLGASADIVEGQAGTGALDARILDARILDAWIYDVAFLSAETGLIGPVAPIELIDMLMEEVLDTIEDEAETTDDHPLEAVRTALQQICPPLVFPPLV